MSRPNLGPNQSPVQLVLEAVSLCVKWMVFEADNPLPSSTEVKNE